MLFALGGVLAERYFKRWVHIAVPVVMLLLFLPLAPIGLPIYSFEKLEEFTAKIAPLVNRWEDGEIHSIPQDYADMTGWEELAEITIKAFNNLDPELQEECIIYAENYGMAGCINFHGKEYGLPQAVSFNDNYILWAPKNINNAPMIYVNHAVGDMDELYNSVTYIDEVQNRYFREDGVKVYFCQDPTDILNPFYAEKVIQIRNRYSRESN